MEYFVLETVTDIQYQFSKTLLLDGLFHCVSRILFYKVAVLCVVEWQYADTDQRLIKVYTVCQSPLCGKVGVDRMIYIVQIDLSLSLFICTWECLLYNWSMQVRKSCIPIWEGQFDRHIPACMWSFTLYQRVKHTKGMVYDVISSPEHEVLMVSDCGQSMSVVRRPSCVVRRPSSVVRRQQLL